MNRKVLETSILLLANERSKMATALFDKGDKAAALRCLNENAQYLDKYANELNARELSAYQGFTVRQALDLNRDGNVDRERAQSQVGKIEGQRGYDLNPKPKR